MIWHTSQYLDLSKVNRQLIKTIRWLAGTSFAKTNKLSECPWKCIKETWAKDEIGETVLKETTSVFF